MLSMPNYDLASFQNSSKGNLLNKNTMLILLKSNRIRNDGYSSHKMPKSSDYLQTMLSKNDSRHNSQTYS